jgi:hypothetical protein
MMLGLDSKNEGVRANAVKLSNKFPLLTERAGEENQNQGKILYGIGVQAILF